MERPVGDKFKINGCVYVVVEDNPEILGNPCVGCAFERIMCGRIIGIRGRCVDMARSDRKAVHFEHFGVDF